VPVRGGVRRLGSAGVHVVHVVKTATGRKGCRALRKASGRQRPDNALR
jgi:hypothetical protein